MQLGDVAFEVVGGATRRDRDEDRALAVPDRARRNRARELRLEVTDPGLEVELDLGGRQGSKALYPLAIAVGRPEGGGVGERREPVAVDADRHHGVEAEQEQVRFVVPRQTLAAEVRVDAAQAAQAAATGAQTTPVGQLDRVGVAHHHVLDIAPAVDQDADLSPDLPADLRQLPGQLLCEQLIGRDAAPEEPIEPADLAGFEAVRVAEDLHVSVDGVTGEAPVHLPRFVELGEHMRPFLLGAPARPGVGHLL